MTNAPVSDQNKIELHVVFKINEILIKKLKLIYISETELIIYVEMIVCI